MRISDWSSDVCSSDLFLAQLVEARAMAHRDGGPQGCGRCEQADGFAHHLRALVIKQAGHPVYALERKSVVEGKSASVRVDLGGRCISKKINNITTYTRI